MDPVLLALCIATVAWFPFALVAWLLAGWAGVLVSGVLFALVLMYGLRRVAVPLAWSAVAAAGLLALFLMYTAQQERRNAELMREYAASQEPTDAEREAFDLLGQEPAAEAVSGPARNPCPPSGPCTGRDLSQVLGDSFGPSPRRARELEAERRWRELTHDAEQRRRQLEAELEETRRERERERELERERERQRKAPPAPRRPQPPLSTRI